jgi:hypothetical protein
LHDSTLPEPRGGPRHLPRSNLDANRTREHDPARAHCPRPRSRRGEAEPAESYQYVRRCARFVNFFSYESPRALTICPKRR